MQPFSDDHVPEQTSRHAASATSHGDSPHAQIALIWLCGRAQTRPIGEALGRVRCMSLWRLPLFRLLAINLAAGAAVATLMLGGLLALDPHGLRGLILADRSPGIAIGLLLFGLFITFGSAAMGAAIMALGRRDDGGRGSRRPVMAVAPVEPAPARAKRA
jgi:hypothetical protein